MTAELNDPLSALLHEQEVMERYGRLFADRELRQARKNREIAWYDLRKGPFYTRDQLMDYLKLYIVPANKPDQGGDD